MSVIHFVGGEKGGVGKSVFSRLMSQYFLDKHQPFRAFDADQSHHTLTRFYSDYATQINLDEFESTDQIMEATEDATQHILVDLPAQSERFLDRWIEENGVIDLCEEIDVPFYYWYVVDDGVVPGTQHVRGSNHCLIGLFDARPANKIIVISTLDNLVKGSAGQAMQNFNLAFGLPETTGLNGLPLFP